MTRGSSGLFLSFALALISLPASAIEVQLSDSVYVTFHDCQPSFGQSGGLPPVLVGAHAGDLAR